MGVFKPINRPAFEEYLEIYNCFPFIYFTFFFAQAGFWKPVPSVLLLQSSENQKRQRVCKYKSSVHSRTFLFWWFVNLAGFWFSKPTCSLIATGSVCSEITWKLKGSVVFVNQHFYNFWVTSPDFELLSHTTSWNETWTAQQIIVSVHVQACWEGVCVCLHVWIRWHVLAAL